ncbi:hypothetical protein BABINDRAFT_151259, partial [Babjeviella inositovora NRRL Y-12698]
MKSSIVLLSTALAAGTAMAAPHFGKPKPITKVSTSVVQVDTCEPATFTSEFPSTSGLITSCTPCTVEQHFTTESLEFFSGKSHGKHKTHTRIVTRHKPTQCCLTYTTTEDIFGKQRHDQLHKRGGNVVWVTSTITLMYCSSSAPETSKSAPSSSRSTIVVTSTVTSSTCLTSSQPESSSAPESSSSPASSTTASSSSVPSQSVGASSFFPSLSTGSAPASSGAESSAPASSAPASSGAESSAPASSAPSSGAESSAPASSAPSSGAESSAPASSAPSSGAESSAPASSAPSSGAESSAPASSA